MFWNLTPFFFLNADWIERAKNRRSPPRDYKTITRLTWRVGHWESEGKQVSNVDVDFATKFNATMTVFMSLGIGIP